MIDEVMNQKFDMDMKGWTYLGTDPDDRTFWSTYDDIPGSGFNFVSYSNLQIDDLYIKANSIPGCNPADRAPLYKQIQRILHDDVAYVFLFGNVGAIGYTDKYLGVQPGPWDFYADVEKWSIR